MDEQTKQEAIKRIQLTRALEDNQYQIPFKGGRPVREPGKKGFIQDDDITNLRILLNTAESFEEFLYNC